MLSLCCLDGTACSCCSILFLPYILCSISTQSPCQLLRSLFSMNITWNGTEQSCSIPGCTRQRTAVLKVNRVALSCSPLSRQTRDGMFLVLPAMCRSQRCCVQFLLVRINKGSEAWCVFALRLKKFTKVKTGIMRETTGGLSSAQCLPILYCPPLSCNTITLAYILEIPPNPTNPRVQH